MNYGKDVPQRRKSLAHASPWNHELSDDQNVELYDKCANPNGHGHNFILEVTVAGKVKGEKRFCN